MTQLEISYLLALKNYNLTPSADLKSCKTDIKWTKEFSCLKVKKKKRVESGGEREMLAFEKA